MRIGLVCPYSFGTPGGVQNHVLGLAGYLLGHGHHPQILAPGEFNEERARPYGVTARHFTSAGTAVSVRYNGSIARVNFGPFSATRVQRWLRVQQFDLLHIHEPITPSISMLALWAATAPVVATFHTATPRSRSMQLARGALRASIEKIEAGIAVSDTARKVVVQHLGRDAVVIPNGFCYDYFASAPADLLSTGHRWRGGPGPRLTFLGRLDEPRKGLDVLLAALPTIRTAMPDLEVIVAGQGSRALPGGVRALGEITDHHRAALLHSTDVFVAPHVERESFGLVVVEAMASGAAVVASDLPAFVDLLRPAGSTTTLGHLFPAGDPAALAGAVHDALVSCDPIRPAAQQASLRYDWQVVGAKVVDVYAATLTAGAFGSSRYPVAGRGGR